MRRKIIVYIATSADGYIARPDGDIEWLNRRPVKGNYGMAKFFRKVDTAIMGRKTFEIGVKLGQSGYPNKKNYVFTGTPRKHDTAGGKTDIEFVTEDVAGFAKRLRKMKGRNVWLVGGSEVIASFLDAGEVDEFVIHVLPVFIGEGIPLIHPRHRDVPLKLLKARRYSDGVVRLHYRVAA